MAGNTEEEMKRSQFSLTETLEEVSQQGEAQDTELKRDSEVLTCLQATLSKVEKSSEVEQLEFNSTGRMNLSLADETVQLQKRTSHLESELQEIYMECMKLQGLIQEGEDHFQLVLAEYNTYRNNMESHISHQVSQTAVHRELVEERANVKRLTVKREELRADLQNPGGNVMWQAQSQNRLVKAILKNFRCQLHKVQSDRRQIIDDIRHLEKEVGDLRQLLRMEENTQGGF